MAENEMKYGPVVPVETDGVDQEINFATTEQALLLKPNEKEPEQAQVEKVAEVVNGDLPSSHRLICQMESGNLSGNLAGKKKFGNLADQMKWNMEFFTDGETRWLDGETKWLDGNTKWLDGETKWLVKLIVFLSLIRSVNASTNVTTFNVFFVPICAIFILSVILLTVIVCSCGGGQNQQKEEDKLANQMEDGKLAAHKQLDAQMVEKNVKDGMAGTKKIMVQMEEKKASDGKLAGINEAGKKQPDKIGPRKPLKIEQGKKSGTGTKESKYVVPPATMSQISIPPELTQTPVPVMIQKMLAEAKEEKKKVKGKVFKK